MNIVTCMEMINIIPRIVVSSEDRGGRNGEWEVGLVLFSAMFYCSGKNLEQMWQKVNIG